MTLSDIWQSKVNAAKELRHKEAAKVEDIQTNARKNFAEEELQSIGMASHDKPAQFRAGQANAGHPTPYYSRPNPPAPGHRTEKGAELGLDNDISSYANFKGT